MDPLGPRPAYASFCSSIPADNPFERGEARDRPDGARALAAGGAAGAFSLFQQPPLEPFAPRAAEPSGPEPSEARGGGREATQHAASRMFPETSG